MRVVALLALGLAAFAPGGRGLPPHVAAPVQAGKGGAGQAAPAVKDADALPALQLAIPPAAPGDALRKTVKGYAEATGTELAAVAWDGAALDGLKANPPDLALLSASQVANGCGSGVLAKLDWARLGRDRYQPAAVSDCGVGAYLAVTALTWDRDKVAGAPDWGAFWDVARHPGRRGMPKSAKFALEIALLADGVGQGDVYRTLRSGDGLDRAFRKLDQLKPYIMWWDQPAQAAQLLVGGKVLLIAAPVANVLQAGAAAHRHFGVQWAGGLAEWHSWAVPKAAPHPEAAALALVIAGDPARQALFAEASFFGPAVKDALELMPAAVRAQNQAANQAGTVPVDDAFWAENKDKLEARFAAWVAK